jgi:hypothetical protein
LGAEPGEAVLNATKESVFNSFREPSTEETDHQGEYNQVVDRVAVRVERLDALLPELQRKHGFTRALLKTDTRGFDLEVFAGSRGIRETIPACQCELPIKRIYRDTPALTEALGAYEAAGYELAGVFPVNPHQRRLVELDCFFRLAGAD